MREHEIGRLENGRLVVPTEREYKGIVISNPTNEQLKFLRGYFDIDREQINSLSIPEFDETTHMAVDVYFMNTETNKINKRYDIVEIPKYDEQGVQFQD